MKLYVRAHAKRRSDVKADLEEHMLPCMEALAQLYLFPYANERNHWRTEVWNHYRVMSKCKPGNKLLSAQAILDNTWGVHKDDVLEMMYHAIEHEEEYEPDEDRFNDVKTLENIMQEYFIWIAETLSERGIIRPSASYEKLEELGL